MKLELEVNEVKIIIEILRYALDSCSVGGITNEVDISEDGVEGLVQKLQNVLQSNGAP